MNEDTVLLLEKLGELSDRQAEQNSTLVRLTVTVEEHVKRSNLLEEAVKATNSRIEPLEHHKQFLSDLWLILSVIGGVGTGLLAALHYAGYFSSAQ